MSNKMLVWRAANLVREPLSRPVRRGKTQKDHANGNPARNIQRKLARADWQQNSKSADNFPI